MRITRLTVEGFRGLGRVTLDLSPTATVLFGVNGSGKSALLDAVALMLSRVPDQLEREFAGRKRASRPLSASDITNWQDRCALSIEVEQEGQRFAWTRSAERRLRARFVEQDGGDGLRQLVEKLTARFRDGRKEAPLPTAVFYPTNRAVLDIPLRIRSHHPFDQLESWALHAGESRFRLFFEWFRDREDLENEHRLERPEYRDRELEAVRRAIATMQPGLESLRVSRAPLRMLVSKAGRDIELNQLSDGEKCLLAMVADMARRLAMANPAGADPLQGEAVVLIDEIDLHLHPSWQRGVLDDLSRTFPNAQFLVSTHSPQVLSMVKPENARLLRREGEALMIELPEASYGRDSNRILEDLMEVAQRPPEIAQRLRQLFRLIDDGELAEARQLRAALEVEIGTSEPEFVRADILLRRRDFSLANDHQGP